MNPANPAEFTVHPRYGVALYSRRCRPVLAEGRREVEWHAVPTRELRGITQVNASYDSSGDALVVFSGKSRGREYTLVAHPANPINLDEILDGLVGLTQDTKSIKPTQIYFGSGSKTSKPEYLRRLKTRFQNVPIKNLPKPVRFTLSRVR
jgi:hypothetical protein